MTAPTSTKLKRSGDELTTTGSKKVPRLGTLSETTTIHNPQVLVSDPGTRQSKERANSLTEPTATNPDLTLLLLQKDQTIEQLRLELSLTTSELAKTQNQLLDTEYKLSEALKRIPKPLDATDVYETGIEMVDTTRQALLDKVHARGPNSDEITTDTFAKDAVRHLGTVKALEKMQDGLIPALHIMMRLANTCWYDPDTTIKMCGCGDSEEPFFQLDAQLVSMIDKAYGEMAKQRVAGAAEWAATTLRYLKQTRDYLADYGVDGYFPQSIAKLETMV